MGGVVVNGKPYSVKECYEKGWEHDPVYSGVWFSLGSIDGGLVNGQPYSAKECYGKGLERDLVCSGARFLSRLFTWWTCKVPQRLRLL